MNRVAEAIFIPPTEDLESLRQSIEGILNRLTDQINRARTISGNNRRVTDVATPVDANDAVNLAELAKVVDVINHRINSLSRQTNIVGSGGNGVIAYA